jgi:hypothetical protein
MKPMGMTPERYLVEEYPNPEQLEQLTQYKLKPSKDGINNP